jgi:hypothetical protein
MEINQMTYRSTPPVAVFLILLVYSNSSQSQSKNINSGDVLHLNFPQALEMPRSNLFSYTAPSGVFEAYFVQGSLQHPRRAMIPPGEPACLLSVASKTTQGGQLLLSKAKFQIQPRNSIFPYAYRLMDIETGEPGWLHCFITGGPIVSDRRAILNTFGNANASIVEAHAVGGSR